MTFAEQKKQFSEAISGLYSREEIQILFEIFAEDILKFDRFMQRNSAEKILSEEDLGKFEEVISELQTGKPYQQILGETEFYEMNFFVNEHVLIPRPETEELLEIAIEKIGAYEKKAIHYFIRSNESSDYKFCEASEKDAPAPKQFKRLKILEIGTGSGIIPIVLKKHFPKAEVTSIDFSEKALEVARRNADFHGLNINFIQADYLKFSLQEKFDVIISNPPYIGIDEEREIVDSVKEFEPKMALFSPASDALIFYRKIAEDCEKHLNKNGLLFLEINQKLGKETLDLYKNLSEYRLLKDLSGNDRFIFGIK